MGFKTNEIIAAMPGVLNLAAAGQMDIARTADIASNILTGFNLDAAETARVVDVMAKAMTTSNTNIEQLGLAMKYAAPIAASTGVSIEETAAAIGKLSDSGIQGEMAGTQLRAILLRLIKPVGDAKDVMDQLGIKTADAQGKILPFTDILRQTEKAFGGLTQASQAEAAAIIAGTEATAGFLTLLNTGADSLDGFVAELQNAGGTAERIADTQMDTFNGSVEEMKSALESVGITVGDDFKPAMRAVVDEITRGLLGFNEMDAETRTFITTMALATTGAGTLATGIYGTIVALRALSAAGITASASLGWITGIAAVVGIAAGAFVSYKVSVEQAAAAQKELNDLLGNAPLSRTAGEVQELKDRVDGLSDALVRRKKLEEELLRVENDRSLGLPKQVQEMRKLEAAISGVDKELRELGVDTPEHAVKVIDEINASVEQSIPALIELSRAELDAVAAKAEHVRESKVLQSEFESLSAKTARTKEENERLKTVVDELTSRYPSLKSQISDTGELMLTNKSILDELVDAEGRAATAAENAKRAELDRWKATAQAALESARVQLQAIQAIAEASGQRTKADYQGKGFGGVLSFIGDYVTAGLEATAQSEYDKYLQTINDIEAEFAKLDGKGSEKSGGLGTGTGTINTGKDKEGKEKKASTAEQLANEAYRAALQMMEKQRLLGKLSEQDEVDRLARLAKQYEKYDAIWIDAESRRQRLVSQMAADAVRAATEKAKDAEAAQRASYEKSAEWIEMETRRMTEKGATEREITEMQLEAWTRVRNRYGKDTDFFKRADKAMFDARMSLRRQDEKVAKEIADAAEKSSKELTKSVLDNIDKQRKAELAALDEQKRATAAHYDDLLRMADDYERGRERQKIVDEAEKYKHATSEKGRKRYEELQEQLRKMDVEDNKRALQDERDTKLKSLDEQKRDIDAWYSDLKEAADSFNGDMIRLYQLTEDERLTAFTTTNEKIKAEMVRFQTEMASITASTSGASAVLDPYKASVLAQMAANSKAWHTADAAGKASLAADSQRLGTEIGGTYRGGSWFGADGLPLFHEGRDGATGRTFSLGSRLMPDELQAILRTDEYVFTPGQLQSLIGGARGGNVVTIEKVVGMEVNDAVLEDDIDIRALGRTATDMATEMARRNFTGIGGSVR